MKIHPLFPSIAAVCAVTVPLSVFTNPAAAAVTPGGTVGDTITVVADIAGETLEAATSAAGVGADLIHVFDNTIGTVDPTYEITNFGAIALSSGRHLVLYNAEFVDGSDANRSEVQTRLDLDFVPLPIGRSQGYTRSNGGVDETITTGGAIITVEDDDALLELASYRSDMNANQTLTRVDGAVTMQLLKLDDSWDSLSLDKISTDGTNVGVSGARVTYDAPLLNTGTAFDYGSGDEVITINSPGLYLVCANTGLEKANNNTRTEFVQHLALDGVEVPGSRTTTYMRGNQNGEGANSGMLAITRILNVSAGQELSVEVVKVTGTDAPIQGSMTGLSIVKLPPTARFLSLLDTSEQAINDAPADPVVFASQVSPINSEFSFTEGGSAVTVNTDSDYLFLGTLFTEDDTTNDNADRTLVRTGWQVDGAGGILAYGQGAEYMRDSGGSHSAGNWCGALLDLDAGQTVQLMTERIGNTDPAEGDVMSLQALSVESLKPTTDPAVFINNPLRVNPEVTSTITSSLLLTYDGDTPDSGLTYTVGSAPTGGTLRHTVNGVLGAGGTFSQDDIINNRIEFTAGATPVSGGFDFTVSDGATSDSSSFLVVVTWPEALVTITADGDITEGQTASWTLSSTLAPSESPLTIGIVYSGSASDGSDFTGVASIEMAVGATTVDLDVATMADAVFEGCELIVAGIGGLSGGNLTPVAGDPSSAVVALAEGNSAPTGDLSEYFIGTGTVRMDILAVADANADFESTISTAGPPVFQFAGLSNMTVFFDGRPADDAAFDQDAGAPALSEADGLSLDLEFTAQDADLTGTVLVFELGGTSNGTSILLVDGIPHLVGKAGGAAGDTAVDGDGNAANGFEDLDWAGNSIVVPLSTIPVAANSPTRLAVIYDIAASTVTYSMNGAASASATLTGNDSTNWVGDHTTAIGVRGSGIGGTTSTAGNVFTEANVADLAGGFEAVSCLRFWNDVTGAVSAVAGGLETVTMTLTISNWSANAGSITALSGNGETYANGVWMVTGDIPTVNAALENATYVPGTAAADPTVIIVSVEDGDEDGGGPSVGSVVISATAPTTVYVDDDFSVQPGAAIADADLGEAGSQAAIMSYDAFASAANAAAAVNGGGAIIVNDGDYSADTVSLIAGESLRLADTTGGVTLGGLAALATSSIDLQGNSLTVRNDVDGTGIDCPITGTGGLTKEGPAMLVLRAACPYTGTTTVNEGILRIGHRTVDMLQASLAGNGPVVVNANGTIDFHVGPDDLIRQTGFISGEGRVTSSNNGTVVFDAPGPNTFTGGFELGDGASATWNGVDAGNKEGFVVVNHSGHLGTGLIRSRGGQLQAGVPGIVIANDIEVDGGGFRLGGAIDFELSGTIRTINDVARGFGNYGLEGLDLTASGPIILDHGTLSVEGSNNRDNGTWTFTGPISGSAAAGWGNLRVQDNFDNGVVIFSGGHTYEGAGTFRSGTTYYNATHTGGAPWVVEAGTTLAGTGSTDAPVTVDVGGTLSPGIDGVGTFTTGDLILSGTLEITVDNTTGSAHDRVLVIGELDLFNGTLSVVQGTTVEPAPAEIVIIENDGADAILNMFGEGVPFSGDYMGSGKSGQANDVDGGDGNDVSLFVGTNSVLGDWRVTHFGSSLNSGPGANDADSADKDGLINLLEFAFGTNPAVADNVLLVADGTVNGTPDTALGPPLEALFLRRKDYDLDGSLFYTVEFSGDLQTFHDDGTPPTVVAESAVDPDYEVVSVPYPDPLPDGLPARFFRVRVDVVE